MIKTIKNLFISKVQESLSKTNKLDLVKNVEIYQKPVFTSLTIEEIADIHERGYITQEEKVREWEAMDLCAPGDAIGSAAWRCRKFDYNCHDCLVDYSLGKLEYESIENILKSSEFQISLKDNIQKTLKKD